jgi:hypothetical protein
MTMPRFHRYPAEALRHARLDVSQYSRLAGANETASRAELALREMANRPAAPRSPVLTEPQRRERDAARKAGRDQVTAIALACNEAGAADRIVEFVRAGMTLEQVRAELVSGTTPGSSTSPERAIARALAGIDADQMWNEARAKANAGLGMIRAG